MKDSALVQASRDREHDRKLREHFETLLPQEKREYRKMGLDKTLNDFHIEKGRDTSETADFTGETIDSRHNGRAKGKHATASNQQALRIIFAEMMSKPNARLALETFSLASGLIYNGDSETEIAQRHHVSRSAVCKMVVFWEDLLGLPPNGGMRGVDVRKGYAKRAVAVHICRE